MEKVSTRTKLDILKKARALIVKGWAKKRWASDKYRHTVPPTSPKACHFCAAGAVVRITERMQGSFDKETAVMLELTASVVNRADTICTTVASFNDDATTTKAMIIELYDTTIDRLKKAAS